MRVAGFLLVKAIPCTGSEEGLAFNLLDLSAQFRQPQPLYDPNAKF